MVIATEETGAIPPSEYVNYPAMPQSPADDPRFKTVDGIWYVTGINFQFAFIDKEYAEHYQGQADADYALGDICRLDYAPRVRKHEDT